jgi:hypothetical protein
MLEDQRLFARTTEELRCSGLVFALLAGSATSQRLFA